MRSRLAALALTALAVPLVACDDSASHDRALLSAQATLAALHQTPGAAPDDYIESTHTAIRRDLAPVLTGPSEASRAAAQLIVGQTYAGDVEIALQRAAEQDAAASRLLAEAQTLASRLYVWRHARADASGTFSASASVAEIDAQIVEAQRQRDTLTTERQEARARLAELRAAMDAANQESQTRRTTEVQLRDRALREEGAARAGTITEVYAAQRAADEAVRTAAEYQARLSIAQPAIDELTRSIDGASTLIELLRTSRESLIARESRGARTAQVDREQAALAAEQLEALLTELHDLRTGSVTEAYDDAASAASQAVSNLRGGASAGASPLWLAAAQHAQAQLESLRAQSFARYADAVSGIAALAPRLPFAGELDSRAKSAREIADAAVSEARDAYDAASTSYKRAARGPRADQLRALADRLADKAAGRTPIDAPDPVEESDGGTGE